MSSVVAITARTDALIQFVRVEQGLARVIFSVLLPRTASPPGMCSLNLFFTGGLSVS